MSYELNNSIALVTIDDGKVNAIGHGYMDQLNTGLDRAQQDSARGVILYGRRGVFSAGFDLEEFKKGIEAGTAMAVRGMELLIRMYSYPLPLVAACTGHAIAMGAFLLLACDNRVGISGPYKFSLPETAINMDLPPVMLQLASDRLAPRYLTRAALQSEAFDPDGAAEVGFLDEVVALEGLDSRVQAIAQQLSQLPAEQYARNKLLVRAATLESMRSLIQSAT